MRMGMMIGAIAMPLLITLLGLPWESPIWSTLPGPASPPTTLAWRWEGPVVGPLQSRYGPRRHPVSGRQCAHRGIDIAAPTGTPARAVRPGRVVFAGWRGGYGRLVEVDHGLGWRSRYAHLSTISVLPSTHLEAGEMVGRVGASGLATGPHLHFEVEYAGTPIDPLTLFEPAPKRLAARE